jgi:hypothetical protein
MPPSRAGPPPCLLPEPGLPRASFPSRASSMPPSRAGPPPRLLPERGLLRISFPSRASPAPPSGPGRVQGLLRARLKGRTPKSQPREGKSGSPASGLAGAAGPASGGTPQEGGASPHLAVPPLRTFSVTARVLEAADGVGAVPGLMPRHFPGRGRRSRHQPDTDRARQQAR